MKFCKPRSGMVLLMMGLAFGLTNCSAENNQLATESPVSQVVAQGTTTAEIVQNWATYSPETGKYTARFPTQPQESKTTADITADRKKQIFLAVYEAEDKSHAFAISYSLIPSEELGTAAIPAFVEQAEQGMARGIDARIISSVPILQGGYEGREVILENATKFQVKARIIYANGVLYQLIVVAQDLNLEDPMRTAFLDAIVLTP